MRQRPFLASALFMLLALWPMAGMRKAVADSPCQKGIFSTPVICSEFLRNEAELRQFYGEDPGKSVCQAQMIEAHHYDAFFLIFYGLFLVSFALLTYRQSKRKYHLALAALALFASVMDHFENQSILSLSAEISNSKPQFEPLLELLHTFTWAKWFGLATYFALLSPFLWTLNAQTRGINTAAKALAITGPCVLLLCLLAFFSGSKDLLNVMASAFALPFLGLFALALGIKLN